jgi:late competence protein required for DNA uptake (superfamily II DNA/RNA helicase)
MKKLEQSRVITATNRWAKEHEKRKARVLLLARRFHRKKGMPKRLAIEKAIEQEEEEELLRKI